jgi:E3 ubiquitin-protein ligase listerin
MAIVSAVTKYAPDPLRLNRYRNELAAALLGISPKKANTGGLLTLRKLAASAPDPESDVEFLPQLRAVNVTKACQQWIGSDEDVDEEVESAMTLIFIHLAPILQDVPGSHWDLIFDVVENNLDVSEIQKRDIVY